MQPHVIIFRSKPSDSLTKKNLKTYWGPFTYSRTGRMRFFRNDRYLTIFSENYRDFFVAIRMLRKIWRFFHSVKTCAKKIAKNTKKTQNVRFSIGIFQIRIRIRVLVNQPHYVTNIFIQF
ncbi:hypothetical protein XENTR_v10006476 [Xenopus tropicalis]|nr:hypothetical protein XENTR_v10006476 [Xenopus tropicalis]